MLTLTERDHGQRWQGEQQQQQHTTTTITTHNTDETFGDQDTESRGDVSVDYLRFMSTDLWTWALQCVQDIDGRRMSSSMVANRLITTMSHCES